MSDDVDLIFDRLGHRPFSPEEADALWRVERFVSHHRFAERQRPRFALEVLLAGVVAAVVVTLVVALTRPSLAPPPPVYHAPPPPTATVAPTLSPSPSPSIPAGFQPEAFSAISESDFWVLGTRFCASGQCPPVIFHTTDAGRKFAQIPFPPVVFLEGNKSTPGLPIVFDIRFANANDGWVFGDQLWATHDGGAHWHQVHLGASVMQLEPGANGYVYATFEDCATAGSTCSYRVLRSRASSDTWSKLTPPGNPSGRPVIGVHFDTVWVMYFNGGTRVEWISRDDGALWIRGSMPCETDLGGNFDPVSNSVIWAFCATGMAGDAWVSTNGGETFTTPAGAAGNSTNGAMVAALSSQRAFIVDPGAGMLRLTTDGGRTFRSIPQLDGAMWGGFTNSEVGYVIVNSQPSGIMQLWRTTNAGATWSRMSLPS